MSAPRSARLTERDSTGGVAFEQLPPDIALEEDEHVARGYLAAERKRFWHSAVHYYQSLVLGYIKPTTYTAWERAKDDLLRVAEYERKKREGRALPPLPDSFRYRCRACGILQETRGVCAECISLYGSADRAMAAAGIEGEATDRKPAWPVKPLAELRDADAIARRIELCSVLREKLAQNEKISIHAAGALLNVSVHTIRAVLRDISDGSDGQPALSLKLERAKRDYYWREDK